MNTLAVPKEDPYFYASNGVLTLLDKINKISAKHPVNVLVSGRQGCGKSSLVRQYAAVHQAPLATFQVGILSEPGQLFGEYALEGGETRYRQFLFPKALQTPGCVIHLEEINRPEHPKALNMLFSLLSDDRQVWMDEIGMIDVAPGVVFFATLNEGQEFVGTEMLDAALRDRFYYVLMDLLPKVVEREVLVSKTGVTAGQADRIIDMANALRAKSGFENKISTRTTLMISEMVNAGASLRDALIATLQISRRDLESVLVSLHLEENEVEACAAAYLLFTSKVMNTTAVEPHGENICSDTSRFEEFVSESG
ncbi:hypothetical protein DSCO28_15800 [Desulfosarcina ovata subsp. sediminis]|uniref:AAA+ ATPase domain-containing protein n=1 Tax=Desulfosarcina ovata subsp. sediminis TaxID=885957 RepID=A0A5K7ZI35_9BACT|nr:MoxR family ATPase [Desulfosarcina ovata]BBO81014.1 hypothetical protein DSCO28_15800 [Desulfosarcina ovata subsp. sediminis]